ncbi:MAG: hypothetical protein IT184_17410 [Acidobacteria bacterium]|nr:hypothetical protein [Acidobacteriota bacterium]
MTNELLWIKDWYWAHRDVVRVAAAGGSLALFQLVLLLWTARRLAELSHIRERMSRLADGLALLTDTTEAGMATLIREVEQLGRRRTAAAPRPAARAAVAKRVVAAHRNGERISEIADAESLSESEVRLHLSLAEAARRDLKPNLRGDARV